MNHNFKCERCGYSCTLKVVLTKEEIKTIQNLGYTDFYETDKNSKVCLKQTKEHDCIFLERDKDKTTCKIYPSRPKPCENYPPYPQDKLCKEFNPAVRAYLYNRKIK
tara:strand:- start:62 stop:382 length:321 start_codon:yes stop_codon:yes gene_type:complete